MTRCLLASVAIYATLAASACDEVVETACIDLLPCVTASDGVHLVGERAPCGECTAGVLDCASGLCVGEKQPSPEVCDGLDNDCDCEVDEGVAPLSPGAPGNFCRASECGPCQQASVVCVGGELVCDAQPSPEVCDGLDNDCDCEVDELPVAFAYSGPPQTAGVGVCRPEVVACIDGVERVVPEVLPQDKDACFNGLDDDCDGLTDENDLPAEPRSVVLVVDMSSSMSEDLDTARDAVCDFALNTPADLYVAIVAIAASGPNGPSFPYVVVVSDFEPALVACDTLYHGLPPPGSASEYQTDGITMGSAGGLPWPSADRAVVVLTDEELQQAYVTVEDVQIICQAFSYNLYVATKALYWPMWADTVAVCGGGFSGLDYYSLTSKLNDWLSPECL